MNFHQCRPAHTIGLHTPSLTPRLSRHNGTTLRGHEGTAHTAAHNRHCSLCAELGSGRRNPTLMRRHQRVARVRATSRAGASEPVLPRSLRCDLVLCCCVMSYSVLILSTIVAIPQRCRRSLYRHRHPRRRRRYCCCCCGAAAVVLRLRLVSFAFVSKKVNKKLAVLLLW